MSAEPVAPILPVARSGSLRPLGTVGRLAWHHLVAFTRSPISAFFAVGFPLLFLVTIGVAQRSYDYGDTGIAMTQFVVASFGALGIAQTAFVVLAVDAAVLRDRGVLKRMRATPVSPASQLAARILTAAALCVLSYGLLLVVGMVTFSVRPEARMLPAATVTLLVGVCCFAALGLAIISLVRSNLAVQTIANATIMPLAFISEIFLVGLPFPRWLDWLGSLFPLKHLVLALRDTFDPRVTGSGFAPDHLAVLAAWTVIGIALAWWGLRSPAWTEPGRGRTRAPEPEEERDAAPPVPGSSGLRRTDPGRPAAWRLTTRLARHTMRQLLRDPVAAFFVVVFPVMLLVLMPALLDEVEVALPLEALLLTSMLTFAAGNVGYVFMTETLVTARREGVLKRWQGSPVPLGVFGAARFLGALALVTVCSVLMFTVSMLAFDVSIGAGGIALVVGVMILGTVCFTAIGMALVALMPNTRSLVAITLGTMMPLGFVSDVFMFNANLPGWLTAVAEVFPLRHLAFALRAGITPDLDNGPFWLRVAVLLAWTIIGLVLARPLVAPARSRAA